jgi:methionyl-tRNA synthetase
MSKNKFYITTPVYYANAQPHIGHAYTTVAADVIVRFKKLLGEKTFLLTGMDEHGAKIAQKAKEEGITPQELVDDVSSDFEALWGRLNIDYDVFTRTTNKKHKKFIQESIQKLYDEGVIYKGEYEGLYCVGCEQFKTESELVEGKCSDHNIEPEIMREESYLMKMGGKQEELIKMIRDDKFKIRPLRYKKEILSFLENNKLEDLSISRKNVDWGIPLPFDKTHTVYVWFDAFLSYVTGLIEMEKFEQFWPSNINLIGKDILRVHSTIWPIILMHLEMSVSRGLFVHGHILSEGKKMSKTLGNVISIDEMLEKFDTDGTRYLLLAAGGFGEDVDMTMERLVEKYNADLANGLGNLVSRVVTLIGKSKVKMFTLSDNGGQKLKVDDFDEKFKKLVNGFEFDKTLEYVWEIVRESNKHIEDTKPWELVKTDEEKFEEVMKKLVTELFRISVLLQFFMPETAEKIKYQLETGEKEILFERIK